VERGLISLDEPVGRVVPELASLEVISFKEGSTTEFYFEKQKKPMTLRHMLTHTSGNAPDLFSKELMAWRSSRGEKSTAWATGVKTCFDLPLTFHPGEGWIYGGGHDWAGLLVSRLNGDISLADYLRDNIFKPLGCQAPWPTFDVAKSPEIMAKLAETGRRVKGGGLEPTKVPQGQNVEDEMGGSGLSCTPDQYTTVLADIISDTPTLLKLDTVTALFTPQFLSGSAELKALNTTGRMIYETWTGVGSKAEVNHTLGGLYTAAIPKLGQPDGMMTWNGALNTAWFASRKHGVAGFVAASLMPPGEARWLELFRQSKRDFWKTWKDQPAVDK
jgi:CubicO group peptidase (beta-lactamase class C family)